MSAMDIDAEREKIRQEIEELERSLGPGIANLETEASGSGQESGSEDKDDIEEEEYGSMEVDPEGPNGASGEEGEAAVSIDLPRTPDTCLQMNLVYQEVLQEKIEEVNALLGQNREQQEKLTWELAGTRGSKSDDGKSLPSNMFLGHFMKPYFKDKTSGFGPPANNDAREKARQGIKSFEELITTKWKSQEKELLRQAVMSDRLRRLVQPKLMNLEYLNEKRTKCRDDMGRQILDKQIQEKEREISDINLLPEETLLGNRGDEHDWEKIANVNFEGTRSAQELQRFWQNTEHPSINKKEWSEDEIERLKEIAARHNNVGWEAIAEELGTQRTAFQCLQVFQANNRGFRKSEWSPKEDQMLLQLVQEMRVGKHIPYRKIAYYMEGRDSTQLLYRWTKRVDPNLKRGSWTPAEDALLLKAVAKHGERDWYKIRAEVPGRSDIQCRYRYLHALHEDIKKGKWSPEEETKLVELTEKYGVGHWAKIASELPHRSGGQCLSKWKIMLGYRRNRKKKTEARLPRKRRKRVPRTSPSLSETSSDDSDLVLEDSGEEGEPRGGRKERGPGSWRVPSLDLWVPTRKGPSKLKPKALPSAPVLSKGFDMNRKRGPAGGPSLDQGDGPSPAAAEATLAKMPQPGQPKAPEASAEDGHQDSRSTNESWRVSLAYVKCVLRNNSYELQRRTRDLRRKRRFAGPAGPRPASLSGPDGGAKDSGQKDGMWKTTVYRRLMMAVTPWAGSHVQSWAVQVKAKASRKTKADFISKQLQSVHLTSRPLFTLFIQLLRIDVDGCMKVIQRKKPKQAELLRSAVGDAGKKVQASSAPAPKAPPSLPAGPVQGGKKLIPLKAKEGHVPASSWEAVPYSSASKPKTVSELLREKRLREAKAAQQQRRQQQKVLLVPPLLLSLPLIAQPQTLPAAGTARRSPGPVAPQALVVASSNPKGTLGSSSGPPGQPEKDPTRSVPAIVASPSASPSVSSPVVPVTWVLTPQGLLPLTVLGLPSQGVAPPGGSGGCPNPTQAAEASPAAAPSLKVAPQVAGPSKGPSSSGPLPSVPIPPSPRLPLTERPSAPACLPSCPSSEAAPPGTAPTPGLTGAPPPPDVAMGSPQPAVQPPHVPPARQEEKQLGLDYSLLSLEDVAAVKAWAKTGSSGGPLTLEACLPYLPPFLCSLKTLSALLLQKDSLAERAASLLAAEGDPGEPRTADLAGLRALVQHHLGENPAYLLLKHRFLAALTFPAALAALPPSRVTTTLSGGRWWRSSPGEDEEDSSSSLEEEEEEEEEEGEEEEEMEGGREPHQGSGDGPGRAAGSPEAQESHPQDPEAPGTDGTESEPPRALGVRSSLRLQKRRRQRSEEQGPPAPRDIPCVSPRGCSDTLH